MLGPRVWLVATRVECKRFSSSGCIWVCTVPTVCQGEGWSLGGHGIEKVGSRGVKRCGVLMGEIGVGGGVGVFGCSATAPGGCSFVEKFLLTL